MAEQISSGGSSSSQSLAQRIQAGTEAVNWWSDRYAWLVVIGVIVAACVFIAQFMFVRRAKELSAIEEQLRIEKARQGSIDTKNKDLEIASAKQAAAEATKRSAEIEHESVSLKSDIEKLRAANQELEAALSPRFFSDQGGAASTLSKFAGTDVIIEYLPDYECRRTALQIGFTLDQAKWNILSVNPNPNESVFFDGVVSYVRLTVSKSSSTQRMYDINDVLISELNRCGIVAHKITPFAPERDASGEAIIIRVGMKPNPLAKKKSGDDLKDPNRTHSGMEGSLLQSR